MSDGDILTLQVKVGDYANGNWPEGKDQQTREWFRQLAAEGTKIRPEDLEWAADTLRAARIGADGQDATEVIQEPELVDLHLDKSGLEFRMRHPIIVTMANHLADAFKAAGGINFVSFEITHVDLGPMTLTMRRRAGQTPEMLADRYRQALEHIITMGAPADIEHFVRDAIQK
jgi:DNA-directed RNA polymerase subunit L